MLVAVCGCLILGILKNSNRSYVLIVQIAVILLIFITFLPQIKELFSLIDILERYENVSKESLFVLLKVFSLFLAGGIVGDVLRDNGENALGGVVEFAVKIMGIVLAIPVLSAVISVALGFAES